MFTNTDLGQLQNDGMLSLYLEIKKTIMQYLLAKGVEPKVAALATEKSVNPIQYQKLLKVLMADIYAHADKSLNKTKKGVL